MQYQVRSPGEYTCMRVILFRHRGKFTLKPTSYWLGAFTDCFVVVVCVCVFLTSPHFQPAVYKGSVLGESPQALLSPLLRARRRDMYSREEGAGGWEGQISIFCRQQDGMKSTVSCKADHQAQTV